jgi:DNA-directed RNA polymerase specialized sigma24 family protein
VQARSEWIGFYDTHYHRVVRFVMHNGASQADAQDAAQEAFIESWALVSSDPDRWQAITGKAAWIRTGLAGARRKPGTRCPISPSPGPGTRN